MPFEVILSHIEGRGQWFKDEHNLAILSAKYKICRRAKIDEHVQNIPDAYLDVNWHLDINYFNIQIFYE